MCVYIFSFIQVELLIIFLKNPQINWTHAYVKKKGGGGGGKEPYFVGEYK